jgi:hypothetical protein
MNFRNNKICSVCAYHQALLTISPSFLIASYGIRFLCPPRRDSVVDIAVSYRLFGLGFESRQGGFSCLKPPRPTLGPPKHPIQWEPGFLPDGKATGVKS